YPRTLIEEYGRNHVHFRAHGIFSAPSEYPDFSVRGNPEHRILAFGKWGTYKRLETLLESFANILERLPQAPLVIAGSDHPATPGYMESVARRFHDCPRIEFRGYVAEEDIPELFRTASVVVMPYNSATGASRVAHLACQYGLPIISADIPDFREMADDENIAISFFQVGNPRDLPPAIVPLPEAPARQREMAE